MGTTEGVEISYDVPPYIRVYADGTVQRLAGTEFTPAAFDPATGVSSKDVVIDPVTGVFARIYRPVANTTQKKLPLVVYFHGGAFFLSSVGDPNYHGFLNVFVAKVNVVLVSVNYRKAPEHPLPAAYEDSWAALQWIIASRDNDDWLMDSVLDLNRVFLAGDSAGANISHHVAIKSRKSDRLKFSGIIMIHPYFWGEIPIGIEVEDQTRKAMVDKWWEFVCPSKEGNQDSLINPFVNGISDLENLACDRIIVCVAGKDILRERGKLYYESLVKSEWRGKAEIIETEDEDHVFHIFDPYSDNAAHLLESLDAFINQNC